MILSTAVLSYRANRIKNDASLEELRKVLAFYEATFERSGADLLRLMDKQGYSRC